MQLDITVRPSSCCCGSPDASCHRDGGWLISVSFYYYFNDGISKAAKRPGLSITRESQCSMVPSGLAAPGSDGYKRPPGHQGLGFSGGGGSLGRVRGTAVSSGVRATTLPRASSGGALRRATGGDAPIAGGQASTALPNRTSGGGAP
ncbi:uncharacterized protein [Zea mays]|uniref:uncharacterized protein n=1 Tax=Zea mays TaxID=4577 RepID=UPI0009AA672C|nr:uncharacterized protein LOC109942302 [Zea mays]|eukprot:XP_020399789.1 uncharacterized protein LOC109942302 [Zea mays]